MIDDLPTPAFFPQSSSLSRNKLVRCAECDEEVGTKCEDGHPLTPYRVTFSTEDAKESPPAGQTAATGGGDSSLSPVRPSSNGAAVGGESVDQKPPSQSENTSPQNSCGVIDGVAAERNIGSDSLVEDRAAASASVDTVEGNVAEAMDCSEGFRTEIVGCVAPEVGDVEGLKRSGGH